MKCKRIIAAFLLLTLLSACGAAPKSAAPEKGQEQTEERAPEKTQATPAESVLKAAKPAQTPAKAEPKANSEETTTAPKPGKQPQTSVAKAPEATEKAPAKTTAPTTKAEKVEKVEKLVSLTIRGSQNHGVILKTTKIAWKEGDTAFSVLQRVTREKGIPMEFQGSGGSVYVEGIDNLYEFDEGAGSGWLYLVNHKRVEKSAGACALRAGDTLEWVYTLNMGKDLT